MRFAYADPPYPGQSKRLYGDHPDYAGEVDHAELVARLCRDYPDGWALSTSANALREVLHMCPPGVRIAAWHKNNAPPIRTTGRWIWAWEPVIVHGGRQVRFDVPDVRDAISCRQPQSFPGMKPPEFTRWMLELLGAVPEDTIDDLFGGSGLVAAELKAFASQLPLEPLFEVAPSQSKYVDRRPGRKHHAFREASPFPAAAR